MIEYSTAIVTGAGLDTETHWWLRLAPDAVIAEKKFWMSPTSRFATPMLTLYYVDHSTGVDQIHQFRSAQTDDLGEYELTPLAARHLLFRRSGTPWYAIHPRSESPRSESAGSNPTHAIPTNQSKLRRLSIDPLM